MITSEEIGSGSTIRVFKGIHNGQAVAIAKLHPRFHAALDPIDRLELAQRLSAADSTWRRLSHPNVARFLGFYVAPDGPVVVTELAPAGSLPAAYAARRRAQPGWRPPLKQSLAHARDLMAALAFLHGQAPPLAHGAVRPARLLLSGDRGGGVLKLGSAAAVLHPAAAAPAGNDPAAAAAQRPPDGYLAPEAAGRRGGRSARCVRGSHLTLRGTHPAPKP